MNVIYSNLTQCDDQDAEYLEFNCNKENYSDLELEYLTLYGNENDN